MSDKPLSDRLQLKGDRVLAVVNANPALVAGLNLPGRRASVETADIVLLFAARRAELDNTLRPMLSAAKPAAILWIAYPKLDSPMAADLSRDIIRALAPDYGLDTVAQIALNADWSALRLKRVVP
jgi:hypothetical protein